MKAQEMQQGKIYVSKYLGNGWLVRFDRIEEEQLIINGYARTKGSNYKGGDVEIGHFDGEYKGRDWGGWRIYEEGLREASFNEIQWFEACEKAGKLVEQPKTEEYAIY